MKRTVLGAIVVLVLAIVTAAGIVVPKVGGMGAGFFAKLLCSGVYVSGRAADQVLAEDLTLDNPLSTLVTAEVLEDERAARATFLGVVSRTAVYREGLGCTILAQTDEEALSAQAVPPDLQDRPATMGSWPQGPEGIRYPLPEGIDSLAITAAVANAFIEKDSTRLARTRAVAVVYRGALVAEGYGPGWSAEMPLQAWSMTKSITNALVGIRVLDGALDPQAPAPIAAWSQDERSAITLEALLQMSSGLAFEEEYFNPMADAPQMLFNRASAAAHAIDQPLAHEPGSHWSYSSGTTNIIQEILRGTFADRESYWRFAHERLLDRIGAYSAIIEPDASGTFVGSSYMYATARDWARFGQLYLQDGMWEGERILPEGWVAYSTTPALAAPRGQYGAQIWLNAGDPENPERRYYPSLPTDVYFFSGFDDQYVTVFPSHRLVVVRLGLTQDWRAWDQEGFLRSILDATEPVVPPGAGNQAAL